jgi:class 3 adenylate cyclase
MIEPYLIESVLSSLFDFLKKKVITSPSDKAKFDFIIKDDDGKKIGIEVIRKNLNLKTLKNIESALQECSDLDDFYLITPEEPQPSFEERIKFVFKDSKVKIHWLSINQFIQQNLGIELSEDFRNALLDLQVAAVISKFEDNGKEFIGLNLSATELTEHLKKNFENIKEGKISKSSFLFGLRRQFPYLIIKDLEKEPEKLAEILGFGRKYDDTIIILTDIKNFSSLVLVSDPDELTLMSKYYVNARKLVFKYGGILDKFIGDSVLAIFNYPFKNNDSYTNATKFCSELILMGENMLNEFQRKLDQKIETGTRVAIATGPIYALNIGTDEFEVTFIGDKINLAARLEKNCEVNGILISNKFYNKLVDNDSEFLSKFDLEEKEIEPKDAKGQTEPIKAWQIHRTEMEKIIT